MMMIVLGGGASGKSSYAEDTLLARAGNKDKYYIATMKAYGEDGAYRVARHRKLRDGKGFETLELPLDVDKALSEIPDPDNSAILLECVSNLAANEMFERPGGAELAANEIADRVFEQIHILADQVSELVVVTNNIFEDGIDYDEYSCRYIEAMGQINCRLVELADHAVEVVVGIPLEMK